MLARTEELVFAMCVFLMLTASTQGRAATPKDAYMKEVKARFYFFEEASFERFSCQVQVDAIEGLVKGVSGQFKAAKLPVSVVENTKDFTLSFVRQSEEVSFSEPSLKIVIDKGAKLPDPEATRRGAAQIEAGYQASVVGATQIVRGIFQEMTTKRFEGHSGHHFEAKGPGYIATYVDEAGGKVEERFDGSVRKVSLTKQGQSLSSTTRYLKKAKRGHVLSTVELIPAPTMRVSIKVDYQSVQGVLIPKTLAVLSRQEVGGAPLENRVNVALKGCKVKP